MDIPWWEEDGDIGALNDLITGEELDSSQFFECNDADVGSSSYYDDYGDVPTTDGNQARGNVDRTAIVREFLLDVGPSESNL